VTPRPRRTFLCPHCGAQVAVGSTSCRECGSDASTGWQDEEEVDYQSIDLPEGYRDDAGTDERASPVGARSRMWFWVALVLLLALLVYVTVVLLRMAGVLR
jgi:hypothetical protein